jgi:hypothetical protein
MIDAVVPHLKTPNAPQPRWSSATSMAQSACSTAHQPNASMVSAPTTLARAKPTDPPSSCASSPGKPGREGEGKAHLVNKISKRMQLFAEHHNSRCWWCSAPVRLGVHADQGDAPTKEHLIPKCLQPRKNNQEIVLAHKRCNELRGTSHAKAFRRLMDVEAVTKYDLWPHLFSPKRNHG